MGTKLWMGNHYHYKKGALCASECTMLKQIYKNIKSKISQKTRANSAKLSSFSDSAPPIYPKYDPTSSAFWKKNFFVGLCNGQLNPLVTAVTKDCNILLKLSERLSLWCTSYVQIQKILNKILHINEKMFISIWWTFSYNIVINWHIFTS